MEDNKNMDVKVVRIEEDITIGGFSVESTLENNAQDLDLLYNDFLYNGKKEILNSITKNKHEFYDVIWYTVLHKKYKYLLGQKADSKIDEGNMDFKIIPEGTYCKSKFPAKYDGIKAWTDFYSLEIPQTGYKPKEIDDIAFEYYPNGLDGEFELWSLVEKE